MIQNDLLTLPKMSNMVKSYLVKLIFRIIEFANTQMYLPSIHAKGIPSYLMQKKITPAPNVVGTSEKKQKSGWARVHT